MDWWNDPEDGEQQANTDAWLKWAGFWLKWGVGAPFLVAFCTVAYPELAPWARDVCSTQDAWDMPIGEGLGCSVVWCFKALWTAIGRHLHAVVYGPATLGDVVASLIQLAIWGWWISFLSRNFAPPRQNRHDDA